MYSFLLSTRSSCDRTRHYLIYTSTYYIRHPNIMKTIKIYLAIASVLLVIALGFGVYIWYMVQNVHTEISNSVQKEVRYEDVSVTESGTEKMDEKSIGTVSNDIEVEPIVVQTESLTDTQQKMLKTLGYTQDSVTITPEMIVCAEKAVGSERLQSITDGNAPSPMEAIKLLPCFKE